MGTLVDVGVKSEVKITIDGNQILAPEGATILEAATSSGIYIPHLCHDPRLKPFGACRVCIVEVAGARGFQPACSTRVAEGMVVSTDTPALSSARKTVVELILSDHPLDCLTCEKAGNCELQEVAYRLGIKESRFKGARAKRGEFDDGPIYRDYDKCILCGRCVRICSEVQAVSAIDFFKRGFNAGIGVAYARNLADSDCEFCGQCVSTCPVGAILPSSLRGKGRSWEFSRVRTVCPYCGCGCTIDLLFEGDMVVGVSAPIGEGVNGGNLCSKGRFGFSFVNHPDRLKSPLVRKDGELVPASWDEALKATAEGLKKAIEVHGPDAVGGLASAKCTNEENYLFQKFMRVAVGTNNVDHCARL